MDIEILQEEINTAKNFLEDLKANDSRKAVVGKNRFGIEIIVFIGKEYLVYSTDTLYSTPDETHIQEIIDYDMEEYEIKTNFKRLLKSVVECQEKRIKEMEAKCNAC